MRPRKIEIGKSRLDHVPDRVLVDVRRARDRGARRSRATARSGCAPACRSRSSAGSPRSPPAESRRRRAPPPPPPPSLGHGHLVAHDLPFDRAAGTKCMTTNTTSVIPMNVGMISSNRRMKYAVIGVRAGVAAGGSLLARTRASTGRRLGPIVQLHRRVAHRLRRALRLLPDRSTRADRACRV